MKIVFSIFTVFILIGVCVTDAFACFCKNEDLDSRFKKANAVFIGRLYDYEKKETSEIQNYKEGLPILAVEKSWKGINTELVAVTLEEASPFIVCEKLTEFEAGAQYLVFAYGKELKVKGMCSDTRKLKSEYNQTMKDISKLDSFWFRSWSKLKFF